MFAHGGLWTAWRELLDIWPNSLGLIVDLIKIWSCCISDIHCPIYSKLHMYDKSPGLTTYTQKSCTTITVPPGGNRKFQVCLHVLHLNVLLLVYWPQTCHTLREGPQHVDEDFVWNLWVFVQQRVFGVVSRFKQPSKDVDLWIETQLCNKDRKKYNTTSWHVFQDPQPLDIFQITSLSNLWRPSRMQSFL